jgi:hypothetical protein
MANIEDCINSALGQGAIDKNEADLLKRRLRRMELDETIAGAKAEQKAALAKELRAEAAETKRIQGLAEAATDKIRDDMVGYNLRRGNRGLISTGPSLECLRTSAIPGSLPCEASSGL